MKIFYLQLYAQLFFEGFKCSFILYYTIIPKLNFAFGNFHNKKLIIYLHFKLIGLMVASSFGFNFGLSLWNFIKTIKCFSFIHISNFYFHHFQNLNFHLFIHFYSYSFINLSMRFATYFKINYQILMYFYFPSRRHKLQNYYFMEHIFWVHNALHKKLKVWSLDGHNQAFQEICFQSPALNQIIIFHDLLSEQIHAHKNQAHKVVLFLWFIHNHFE